MLDAITISRASPASQTSIFPTLFFSDTISAFSTRFMRAASRFLIQFRGSKEITSRNSARTSTTSDNFVIWPGFTPMRIVLPGINCLVDFANFVNAGHRIHLLHPWPLLQPTAPAPWLTFHSSPTVPGVNPNDGLQGTPIVFWGAPVGTAQPDINGQLPTPPPIPTDWSERLPAVSNQEFL